MMVAKKMTAAGEKMAAREEKMAGEKMAGVKIGKIGKAGGRHDFALLTAAQ